MANQMVAYILNIFGTMLPIKWIRCVLFPTLLFSSQQYPGADASGNSTNCRCCCIYEDKVYNLAPLQKDGPRFLEAVGTLNWEYAYSPCRSFSKGEPCPVGDVAVCRWDKNDPKGDHEIIGCQSKFSCGIDKPQLEYTAIKNPDWKAIIRLECNPSLDKPDDAKFEVLQDNTTIYVFTLSHKCACPNGCPEEIPTSKRTCTYSKERKKRRQESNINFMEEITVDAGCIQPVEESGPSQSTPPSTPVATITPIPRGEKNLSITLISGGILAITVCVFVIFYKCRQKQSSLDTERRCFMDQTGGNGEEKLTYQSNNVTDHLTDREDNVSQDPIKSFIKNPIGGSRSPSTSCKIRELKKDNLNKLNAPL